MSSSLKVVNAHPSRSKRRTVGVSAVALGAILATYAGALRNVGYAQSLGALTTCSSGSIPVSNDTDLRNAIVNSSDRAVICVTADITVSQTLQIDDTTLTIEGSGNPTLSGGGVRQIINADFTDNASDDTLTLLNLSLDGGSHAGQGGAVDVVGQDYEDALVISGVTVTNSAATGGAGRGGAVAARYLASVSISDNSVFTDNQAEKSGGAIYLYRAGVVDISGVDLERNQALEAAGGALYVGANAAVALQLLTVTNSDFIDNESTDGGGGAVGIRNFDDTVSMTNVSFIRNKALDTDALTDGGGAISSLSSNGAVLLSHIRAYDNRSTGAGGFIYDDSQVASNPITVTDLISTRNYADDSGGSLFVADGSLTIQNSTFTDDSAALNGGAVYAKADSLTVTNSGFYSAYTPKAGGAIYVDSASVYLHDSTFDGNSSGDVGGAIYHTTRDSDFTVAGGAFYGNKAVESGGAIYVESENVVISGGTFLLNQSQDSGGAIAVYENGISSAGPTPSTVTIQNSAFEANTAEFSGGSIHIYARDDPETTDDTLVLSGLTFADDSAARNGGSIYVYAEGSLTISDVTATNSQAGFNGGFAALNFEDPSFPRARLLVERTQLRSHRALGLTPPRGSTGMGAALYLRGSRSAEITETTIAGSIAAANGGGIYSVDDSAITLVNSTITGNSAAGDGGGIFIDPNAAGSVDIDFTTIVGNSAGNGGGLTTDDTVSLTVSNVILSGNSATTSGSDAYINGSSSLTSTYSIFGSAATVTGATINDDSNIFGDPRLNSLADNGGPTLTRLPQWDSPVIGAGDPNWSGTPAFDQRGSGFPRDAGGAVSVGAVQGFSPKPAPQPPTPVPPSAPLNVTGTARDAEATITWSPPTSAGSFPISSYQAVVSPGGQSCLVASSPCTITGLTNGTEYTVQVRALSGAGWGPFSSPSAPFTPETPPAPPVEKTMVITGSRGEVRGRPGVIISGSSTGMAGEQVAPWIKFPGQTGYAEGSAHPTIDVEGDFSWQRRTGKKIYVYFRSLDSDVKSNRVIIAAR